MNLQGDSSGVLGERVCGGRMSFLSGGGVTVSIEIIHRPQEISATRVAAKLLPLYQEDFRPSVHNSFTSRRPWQLYLHSAIMIKIIYKFYLSLFF